MVTQDAKGATERFFYKLIPPRPTFAQGMTEAEARVMQQHAVYWKDLTDRGIAVVYGLVSDPLGGWGMAVVQVQNEAEARALGLNDPSVLANINFKFEIYPMPGPLPQDEHNR